MEYKNIDKEIYRLPGIRHTFRHQHWAWICIGIGIVAAFLYFTGHSNPLWLGLLIIGGFALVSMVCFYTFGDCHQPYHKPSHQRLDRSYIFYAASCKEALLSALNAGDEAALEHVKKTSNPELVLVRYSSGDNAVIYSQIKRSEGAKFVPDSEIISNRHQNN